MSGTVGRFAPSPSGRLHLGNLACSLLAWLSAKHQGGKIVLRIEDLDAERCPRKYADQLEEDLSWLGLVWDEGGSHGGPHGPYYQSECAPVYEEAYAKLAAQGLVYPCFCSRSQLHAASAPHTSDGNVIYPGTCRDLTPEEVAEKRKHKAPAYRVRVPDENVRFVDGCMGPHTENLLRDCGDFYLRRADGVFAYQLAVVVDDARMGVTEVVRGADLLSSTARQLYLYRLLANRPENALGVTLARQDADYPVDAQVKAVLTQPLDALIKWAENRPELRAIAQQYGELAQAGTQRLLPGPTGERNTWTLMPRERVLCMADDEQDALVQLAAATATGCEVLWPEDALHRDLA